MKPIYFAKLTFPKSWNDVTIRQGQLIAEAMNTLETPDLEIELLVILSKQPTDYFESLPQYELLKWVKKLQFLDVMPNESNVMFVHGAYKYKFKTSANQLSAAEFAAIQEYNKDSPANPHTLHKTLALLSTKYSLFGRRKSFHPDKLAAEMDARAELFLNHMPYGLAYSYAVFFSRYYPIILEAGQVYLENLRTVLKKTIESNTSQAQ